MIIINALNKYYPVGNTRFHALKNINLVVNKGEFLSIEGKSGAGKSTLLHIIGCLDSFDSGEYFLKENSVKNLGDGKTAKLRNKEIGFVLQDFSLLNHKSALFNAMLPMFFNATPYAKMAEKAMQALRLVGIEDQAKKRVNQLSGGQRQRVAIARAMVNNPSLILADEPTGALDSQTSIQIMELLKSLNENGITIIVVTHDKLVSDYCKRKVCLKDGAIVPGL